MFSTSVEIIEKPTQLAVKSYGLVVNFRMNIDCE